MNWRRWGKGDISLQNSAPVSETLNIINIYLLENSLLFAMQFTVHIFSIFLQWCCFFGPATFKYFKFSSTTTLRLPACTVWPSLLIFFFHFYSFPTDHSVKSLRDSSEGLLLAIFFQKINFVSLTGYLINTLITCENDWAYYFPLVKICLGFSEFLIMLFSTNLIYFCWLCVTWLIAHCLQGSVFCSLGCHWRLAMMTEL